MGTKLTNYDQRHNEVDVEEFRKDLKRLLCHEVDVSLDGVKGKVDELEAFGNFKDIMVEFLNHFWKRSKLKKTGY